MYLLNETAFMDSEELIDTDGESLVSSSIPHQPNYNSIWVFGSMILTICVLLVLGLSCEHYRSKKRRSLLMQNSFDDNKMFTKYLYVHLTFHKLNNLVLATDTETTRLITSQTNQKTYGNFTSDKKLQKHKFKNNRTKKFSYFVSIPEEEEEPRDFITGVN
uniref:Uncharacterized protein n=1 Tax=Clastoptera arizonana TaxID=38151 RepID=A0A1B6D6J6_9HEMI